LFGQRFGEPLGRTAVFDFKCLIFHQREAGFAAKAVNRSFRFQPKDRSNKPSTVCWASEFEAHVHLHAKSLVIKAVVNSYRGAYADLPAKIWLLSAIMLINRAGTMVLVFFVLYLTNVFGYSDQTAGGIISISALGGIAGALFGGWIADRFGSVRAQLVFLTLTAIQFLFLMRADSLFGVTVMLVVLMFFNEAVRPGLNACCLEYSQPKNQKRSMGLLRLAVNLGMAVGPVIGGFLAEYDAWDWMFLIDAASCFAAMILLFVVFGLGKSPTHDFDRQECSDAAGQGDSSDRDTREVKQSQRFLSPWHDPRMLRFGAVFMLTLIVFIQFGSTLIKYLEEVYGFSESQIGLIESLNPILIVAFEMVLIKAVEKYSTVKVIACGSLLICLGFGLLPFGGSTAFCLLAVTVWTFGEMLSFPLATAYVAELSNERNRARYQGFITVIWSMAMVVGPFLGLTLYGIDKNLPWYAALVIGAISFPMIWNLERRMGKSVPAKKIADVPQA